MDTNPFAVLSLIVAPAILTNASSVLIMSTSNRLARAVDRSRELSRQLEEASDLTTSKPRRRLLELKAAEQRTLLLLRGLRSFYAALGGFATAALISLLGAVLAPLETLRMVTVLEVAGVLAGGVAVGALVHGSLLLLRETRIAVQIISERTASVRERMEQGTAADDVRKEERRALARLIVLRGVTGSGKSTAAARLALPPHGYAVMELDDVKLQKYGSTEWCRPEVDFADFGRAVKARLERGENVVAVESFIERPHLDWFLEAVGRGYDSPRTFFVWLECTQDESGRRKTELSDSTLVREHQRAMNRYHVDGELEIETSRELPEMVAQKILLYATE